MKQLLRISKALLLTYYAYMLEYRAELLLWALSGSLPFILMGVWTQAAEQGNFGLSSIEFARYFLAVYLVRQLTVVWVIWDFERDIVDGKLSFRLLQPLDPVWHHIFSHIGERFARLPFIFGLVALFFLLYPDAFWVPNLSTLLLFTIASTSAFALQFLIQYTLAMFAFWTEKASAIQEVWFLVHLFLSGAIAPLEIFPPAVRSIALWTPFPYIINFPASILTGLKVDLIHSFGTISIWVIVFSIVNRWLWKKGLRQYSGMGA
ncbi:ABC-2 family transporter protein [Chamaesiphon sp. VAR_48_metabat_135_sub]|uniref:ABC transporter permease n=1 Tax=Chamaesiphon sp. VAR_48_metabat_135_sub TaxID=2964699 RepID=UPI00286AF4C1|nr:ABC-2 family transporter protein [Chamaesiphon sp. VAR_48_metabat_135_sub]